MGHYGTVITDSLGVRCQPPQAQQYLNPGLPLESGVFLFSLVQ